MTVIAWDGLTLAADKMSTFDGLQVKTTKIRRLPFGHLFGAAGDSGKCRELFRWHNARIEQNRSAEWVENPHPGECGNCMVIVINDRKECELWEGNSKSPVIIETGWFAVGAGASAAMAAMHCGRNSRQAVDICALYQRGCGLGCDWLEWTQS